MPSWPSVLSPQASNPPPEVMERLEKWWLTTEEAIVPAGSDVWIGAVLQLDVKAQVSGPMALPIPR
jgi:hypothetical protein